MVTRSGRVHGRGRRGRAAKRRASVRAVRSKRRSDLTRALRGRIEELPDKAEGNTGAEVRDGSELDETMFGATRRSGCTSFWWIVRGGLRRMRRDATRLKIEGMAKTLS